jgi:hypothetical protein
MSEKVIFCNKEDPTDFIEVDYTKQEISRVAKVLASQKKRLLYKSGPGRFKIVLPAHCYHVLTKGRSRTMLFKRHQEADGARQDRVKQNFQKLNNSGSGQRANIRAGSKRKQPESLKDTTVKQREYRGN